MSAFIVAFRALLTPKRLGSNVCWGNDGDYMAWTLCCRLGGVVLATTVTVLASSAGLHAQGSVSSAAGGGGYSGPPAPVYVAPAPTVIRRAPSYTPASPAPRTYSAPQNDGGAAMLQNSINILGSLMQQRSNDAARASAAAQRQQEIDRENQEADRQQKAALDNQRRASLANPFASERSGSGNPFATTAPDLG